MKKGFERQVEERPSDMDLFEQWSRSVDAAEATDVLYPVAPNLNWGAVARELQSDLKASQVHNAKLQAERTAWSKASIELEEAKAALKKAQEAADELLTKAGLLLEEKQELEKQYKRVSELNGNQAVMVKEADKRRDEAVKAQAILQDELMEARMTGARLMGYIEALEDQAPPVMKAEQRESVLDRIGRYHFANAKPRY